jgi:prepilin-type N-terminal cleavage/methylation domain-containing protein
VIVRNRRGFTLLEALVGIAISSILLVAVFQFATEIITFRDSLLGRGLDDQRKVALAQLLHQDLTSVPRGEMDFSARSDQFSRRTISHEYHNEQRSILDTRVKYYVRSREGNEQLLRQWRWSEIHTRFRDPQLLLSAKNISIQYKLEDGDWS